MVKSCVESISSFFVKNGYISSSKYEWCCYVLEKRFVKLISFLAIFVMGLKMNMLLDTIIFTTSFCLLRKYADGYHAKTFSLCLMYSLLIVAISIKYIGPGFIRHPLISVVIYFVLLIAFIIHISQLDKNIYNKLFIRNISIVSLLVIICKLTYRKKVESLLISSMLFTLITIYIKKIITGGGKNEY